MIEPLVLAAGRRLGGRYRLERPLGRGGMAAVWLAQDERLDRAVAIKVLSDTIADDGEFLERFRREATLAARLQHPNLVRVFDFDAGKRPYLVMEYVTGGDLAELIRAGESPPAEQLARELLTALRHIHSNGVLHRDVKPQNVLVDDEGHVRLTDFGIAQPNDATALTATGRVIGTESYLAPEVLRGEPASERSDLFALGVVLVDAIRGESAASLWSLIDRMRDPDPRCRPDSAASALETLARSGSVESTGEPTQTLDTVGPTPRAGREPARGAAAAQVSSPSALPRPPLDRRTGPAARPRRQPALRSDRRPRALALGALIAGAAVLIAALAFGGDDEPQSGGERPKRAAAKTERAAGAEGAGTGQPAGAASAGGSAAAESRSADGAALNDQGFALINDGRPEEAVPVLEQATAALERSGDQLTFNYALFNLAHALRLSGRPEEAIPLLEERLRYPDQQDVVAAELEAAREDAGLRSPDDAPEPEPKPGKGPKKQVPPPFESDD